MLWGLRLIARLRLDTIGPAHLPPTPKRITDDQQRVSMDSTYTPTRPSKDPRLKPIVGHRTQNITETSNPTTRPFRQEIRYAYEAPLIVHYSPSAVWGVEYTVTNTSL